MELNKARIKIVDDILNSHEYTDYKWIDPQQIVVAQWVRMKCMFGCGEYGHGGACPPKRRRCPNASVFSGNTATPSSCISRA